MNPLEAYFQGAYFEDKRDIEYIDKLLEQVWQVFSHFHTANGWPYEIEENQQVTSPNNFSFSTSSMILFAMALALRYIEGSPLVPDIQLYIHIKDLESFRTVFKKVFKIVIKRSQEKLRETDNEVIVTSGSFGSNDPFTLTWLLELCTKCDHHIHNDETLKKENSQQFIPFYKKLISFALDIVKNAFTEPARPFLGKTHPSHEHPSYLDHVFPLLRAVHLFKVLEKLPKNFMNQDFNNLKEMLHQRVRPHLLNRAHQHLSFYSILNSAFDSAELAFSIEGVLLIDSDSRSLDKDLLDRVFDVIKKKQEESPYWRPLKPFVTTPTGLALLPLSVEIANSLIRICKQIEASGEADAYFDEYLVIFKRYTSWLYTRIARGNAFAEDHTSNRFTGWYSEHIYVPQKINPWQTAQVVIFLIHYRSMLQEHIARTSLRNANFTIDHPKREYRDESLSSFKYWQKYLETKEPLLGFSNESRYKVYAQIGKHYLLAREDDGEGKPHYSMLLYGPPGSGKNYIAESLAKALKWPLITITPSHFIARGEAEVETRAKNIFQTLQEQEKVVILFDEIDRLILDRDSKSYRKQSDIFQFMTPGMLIKLKDLRRAERSIFIIATNYEERIDQAAKRVGRLDDKFLVAPPDKKQRLAILQSEIKKILEKEYKDQKVKPDTISSELTEEKLDSVLCETVLATYGELYELARAVVDKFQEENNEENLESAKILSKIWKEQDQPAIRLITYNSRFKEGKKGEKNETDKDFPANQEPFTEFFILVYLKCEVPKENEEPRFSEEEIEIVKRVVLRIVNDYDLQLLKKGDDQAKSRVRGSLSDWIKYDRILEKLLTLFERIEWGEGQ